jgi:hypothetical protein
MSALGGPSAPAYIHAMTIEDLEKAVASLTQRELDRFRDWFGVFDAARFDAKIERDAQSGALDKLAEQAATDHRAGRTRGL